MKLVTAEVRAALPPLYSQEMKPDPMAMVKFFQPWGSWTWYATEFDGEDTFFGLVDGWEVELGYFSLSELEGVRGPGGLRIERDLYWTPKRLSEVQGKIGAGR
jgi:hypothetical protein